MVERENHQERHKRDFGIIPIPVHLIYDPEVPFHFGLTLNILFGVTCTFGEPSFPCPFVDRTE